MSDLADWEGVSASDGWRVATPEEQAACRCRMQGRNVRCETRPVVAGLYRGRAGVYLYCAEHLRRYGRVVVDGSIRTMAKGN